MMMTLDMFYDDFHDYMYQYVYVFEWNRAYIYIVTTGFHVRRIHIPMSLNGI
jgi:hypothetical protein